MVQADRHQTAARPYEPARIDRNFSLESRPRFQVGQKLEALVKCRRNRRLEDELSNRYKVRKLCDLRHRTSFVDGTSRNRGVLATGLLRNTSLVRPSAFSLLNTFYGRIISSLYAPRLRAVDRVDLDSLSLMAFAHGSGIQPLANSRYPRVPS